MSKSFFRNTSLLLSCPIALSWAASAIAQEPSCELDCIKGFSCEMQISVCSEFILEPPCEPTPYPSCVAVACSSDADCAEHLTCYDGDDSDERPSECVPKHFLACNADADCGVGFTCAPLNPCLDPAEPDCVPDAPEDGKVCFVTETRACQADSECLPGWICENNPLNGFWSNMSENFCNIVDPPLVCMPPHSPIFGHGAAGFLDWAKGVERTFTSVPESECPERTRPFVSYGRGGFVPEQAGEPVVIPNDTSEPGPPPVASDDPTEPTLPRGVPSSGDAQVAQATASGSGCSLANAGNPSAGHTTQGLGLALLVGLAGMAVARRRGNGTAHK